MEYSKKMRRAVERVNYQIKHGWGSELPPRLAHSWARDDNPQQYHYDEMAKANAWIRKGNYDDAYTVLSEEIFEIENDFKERQISETEKNRFYGDVIRRLERMTRGRADKETREYAAELIEMAKKRQSGHQGLEGKTVLGIISIIGIAIGLFSLFPNISGNVITNTSKNFNVFGLFTTIAGLFGLLYFFLNQ